MAEGPSWQEFRGQGNWRLPGTDQLRWWAMAGLLLSLVLHAIAYFVIGGHQIPFGLGGEQPAELRTGPIQIENIESEPMDTPATPPETVAATPPKDAAPLLEDIEVLRMLPKDTPIEMSPDVQAAAFALPTTQPKASGVETGTTREPVNKFNIDADLPDFGHADHLTPTVAAGQVTIDPGGLKMEEVDPRKMIDDMIKQGAGGKAERGSMQGALEDLVGLPPNVLQGKTTVLPGDLLFEYNSAELRESARAGLGKLGMVIDLNPGMYCWIEGYSDLFGGDEFNLDLSQRRAEAVKDYLVKSMRLDPKHIMPRGFGKAQPRVAGGSKEEQAPNRRVEIKMRNTPPPPAPAPPTAAAPASVSRPEPVATDPPKAVLVKPARALPVEEDPPPRAKPVTEAPPKAHVVEETPPRALIPRAEQVDE